MIRTFRENDLNSVMQIWPDTNINAHSFIPKEYWTDNYIAGIFVKEAAQSKGIGKQLLNYVKELKSVLSLNVYQKNIRAISF